MGVINAITLVLYTVSCIAALYIVIAHGGYFKARFKAGVVNLFMLAMLFFLVAYIFKMGVAICIRVATITSHITPHLQDIFDVLWAIAMFGTTFGFMILAVLTHKKRFDLFVYLRKRELKVEEEAKSDENT